MPVFTVFPAIDLHQGKVVRLVQGDLERQTVYGDDPTEFAHRWFAEGAAWLHLVNLDGAFEQGETANLTAVEEIISLQQHSFPDCRIQFGGGVRSLEVIDRLLQTGIGRVILGTVAVTEPELARQAVTRFGADHLAAAVDVKQGQVTIRGWVEQSPFPPIRLGQQMADLGLRTLIYTDVARDGVAQGTNLAGAYSLAEATGLEVILSGGVACLEDICAARQAGLAGVITGRALYTGAFSLREALAFQNLTLAGGAEECPDEKEETNAG